MDEQKKSNYAIIGSIVAVIVAVVGYGTFKYMNSTPVFVNNINNISETPTSTPIDNPPVTKPNMMNGGEGMMFSNIYNDGTYSALGDYFSPGGAQQLGVIITVKRDVVTSAEVTEKPLDGTSKRYQEIFINNFKQYVIGKKLDQVVLTKVSGSSLTPKGWNDAILKIKAQAKA